MGPLRVFFAPGTQVFWSICMICGALAVALVFHLADVPETLKRGFDRIFRRRL